MSLPNQLKKVSKSYNEKNDCAVKAVAVVANASYQEAHEALRLAGRKPRRGTPLPVIFAALRSLGVYHEFKTVADHRGKDMGRCPISRVRSRLPRKGRFLVLTRSHILAVVDGVVLDWTEGRRHQARYAWEVSL